MTSRRAKCLWVATLLQSCLWADPIITFPKAYYSIRDIVERIEQESQFSLDLPFADANNERKVLPPQLKLEDALRWITRYYEKNNGLLLRYDINDKKVTFQKSLGNSDTAMKLLFEKKIKLLGQNWSIHQAMQSVSDQVGMPLDLPAEPKAVRVANYDYECTVADWVEEVRNYWKREHGRYLTYRLGDRGLSFEDDGPAEPARVLHVELLGQYKDATKVKDPIGSIPSHNMDKSPQSQAQNNATVPVDTILAAQPKMNEDLPQSDPLVQKNTSVAKTKLPEMAPLPIEPLDRWIEPTALAAKPAQTPQAQIKALLAKGPLQFFDARGRRSLITNLIRPRPLSETPDDIIALIQSSAGTVRGLQPWLEQCKNLDLSSLEAYERKKLWREAEETWLATLLKQANETPALQAADRGWHGAYGIEVGIGNNPQYRGDHLLKTQKRTAEWLGQQLELNYGVNPTGPWSSSYGLSFNHVLESDQGSWSGLGLHIQVQRTMGEGGLAAIAPFFHLDHTNDFLAPQGELSQNLMMAGLSLQWADIPLKGYFEKTTGVTDVFIDQVSPRGQSQKHFIGGQSLRQESFGLRHRQAWLLANAQGSKGPGLESFVIQRQGKHPQTDGLETGLGCFWEQHLLGWGYQGGLSYSLWNRSESVTQWQTYGRIDGQIFPKGSAFAKLAFENSDSSDPIMSYQSTSLSLGWETKW
jgi:hypothetical protein